MTSKFSLPRQLEGTRDAARRALGAVHPARSDNESSLSFGTNRTKAGQDLPSYYLVYFLLVDLLDFEHWGKGEKVAWSVPITFNDRFFLIEHRKLGLGIFAHDAKRDEGAAREVVKHIQKAVKAAEPFFEWLAKQAIQTSRINVLNKSDNLFDRFTFLLGAYRAKAKEAIDRKDERVVKKGETEYGSWTSIEMPSFEIKMESRWLALSTIDAFFSWTEHVFVHISILSGKIRSAIEVADLAEAEWSEKFKSAMDINDPKTKGLFDKLMIVRRELRNFVAHGAFGKQGEAFQFHSGAGAVPVLLPHVVGSRKFLLGGSLGFDDDTALAIIDDFIKHVWSETRAPAEIYINSGLPLILTLANDGSYARAMNSTEDMTSFVEYLTRSFDNAANMDW